MADVRTSSATNVNVYDELGNSLIGVPVAALSGTASVTATATTQTVSLGTLSSIFPASGYYHLIWNWPATGLTLTSATLRFSDTVGSTVNLDYPLNVAKTPSSGAFSTISQSASTVVSYYGKLTIGMLKTVSLVLNYTGTPSATTASFALYLYPQHFSADDLGIIEQVAYLSTVVSTANQTLIAAPGSGLSIYVTSMEGSNAGASLSAVDFKEGTTTVKYSRAMAANGGGFVSNHLTNAYWKLPVNTALTVSPSAAVQQYFTANFFVAP